MPRTSFEVAPRIVVLVFGLAAAPAGAQSSAELDELAGADRDELLDLLAILDEQTEIATKTRLNADFVPGMVAVLHGRDLEAKGVATVWEALGGVAGVHSTIDGTGTRTLLVRGIGASFGSGQLKVLVDGVPMNPALSGLAQPVMNMPVELVDRIEVVRGPGSAVYGEFAYQGVVNVVTRRDGQRVFGRVGRFDSRLGGGTLSWRDAGNGLGFSITAAKGYSDGADVRSGTDALYQTGDAITAALPPVLGIDLTQDALSNAPGPSAEDRLYESALIDAHWGRWSVAAGYQRSARGDHFGTIDVLPDDPDHLAYDDQLRSLEVGYRRELGVTAEGRLHIGVLDYRNTFDFELLPDGYSAWLVPLPYADPNEGVFVPGVGSFVTLAGGYDVSGYHRERRTYAGADLNWRAAAAHAVLFGLAWSEVEVLDGYQYTNVDQVTQEPLPAPQQFRAEDGLRWPHEGATRRVASVTLQDEITLAEPLTLTLGVRYDDYEALGGNVSPRVAGVYRIDRNQVLKAQFAQAFRPPTFYESAFNPSIGAETIDTRELAYIVRGRDWVLRSVLFHSKLKDLIVGDGIIGFTNAEEARTQGVELDGDWRIDDAFKWQGNLTFADTKDEASGAPVAGAVAWLADMTLLYQPRSDRSVALHGRYVGEREREADDPRGPLGSYVTVGLSGSLLDVPVAGMTLRAGVDNLFDEDVYDPAPMTYDAIGTRILSYPGDYPRPGRQWWLQVGYEF